jgi:hypothetical protein
MESVQQDAILRCDHLEHYDIGIPEMWERADITGNMLTNATGACATELSSFCGAAECLCQCGCA